MGRWICLSSMANCHHWEYSDFVSLVLLLLCSLLASFPPFALPNNNDLKWECLQALRNGNVHLVIVIASYLNTKIFTRKGGKEKQKKYYFRCLKYVLLSAPTHTHTNHYRMV